MTTVNLRFVTGTICPLNLGTSCGQEALSPPPSLWTNQCSYSIEGLRKFLEYETECPPSNFWGTRMIARLGSTERFYSLEFIPRDATVDKTLLVQKNTEGPPFGFFVAPYLPAEMRQKWTDGRQICPEEEMDGPVRETDFEFLEAFLGMMDDFLKNPLSIAAILIYFNAEGKLTARRWIKA